MSLTPEVWAYVVEMFEPVSIKGGARPPSEWLLIDFASYHATYGEGVVCEASTTGASMGGFPWGGVFVEAACEPLYAAATASTSRTPATRRRSPRGRRGRGERPTPQTGEASSLEVGCCLWFGHDGPHIAASRSYWDEHGKFVIVGLRRETPPWWPAQPVGLRPLPGWAD